MNEENPETSEEEQNPEEFVAELIDSAEPALPDVPQANVDAVEAVDVENEDNLETGDSVDPVAVSYTHLTLPTNREV